MTDKHTIAILVGARLREARQQAALTVRAAAERAGVGHTTLVRYENGVILPSVERLVQLAAVYETPPAALFASSAKLAAIIRDLEGADPGQLQQIGSRLT